MELEKEDIVNVLTRNGQRKYAKIIKNLDTSFYENIGYFKIKYLNGKTERHFSIVLERIHGLEEEIIRDMIE